MTKQQPPSQTPPPYPGYPPPYVVYPPEEPINWSEYWRVLVKHRKLIGIITAASTLTALLIAFLLPPVYRAEVLLAPVTQDKSEGLSAIASQYGDLAALAGINVGPSKDKTAEYIAAFKSRVLSVAYIKEANLMPVLFASKWDDAKKQWKDSADAPTEWKAFELWDKDIRRVNLDKRTGLVTLIVEWTDPALAAKWANDFTRHVNTRLRTEAIEDAEKSIAYLGKQLPTTTSVEVQQAIYRLIETQTKKKMVASTREEYAFKVIDAAVIPERKIRPKRILMIVMGFLIGLMFAVSVVLIRNAKGRRGVQTDPPLR
ncbi:MAG: GNVR domain-containing protein [Sulfuricaulis sp.]|uniref:GNVR domain-containing protein n=1 Tax=Sulfuricaulis sp. TaxID=2003553 RepID=UPI0034A3B7BE